MAPGSLLTARPMPFARRREPMRCRRTLQRAPARRTGASFLSHQPLATARGGRVIMRQSHVVEIDGTFVGAAVQVPDGFKFVAVDVRLDGLDGRVLPSLADLRRTARAAFFSGRVPPPTVLLMEARAV